MKKRTGRKKRTSRKPVDQSGTLVDPSELTRDPKNARRRTSQGRAALQSSLDNLGTGRSILLDADNNVIAGNGTLEAAEEAGLQIRVIETDGRELIALKRTNLSGLDATAMAIADNRTGELAVWDVDQLDETLTELSAEHEMSLEELGFNLDELEDILGEGSDLVDLLSERNGDAGDGNDRSDATEPELEGLTTEQLQNQWKVKEGDVWIIEGCQVHRLICGDVRDSKVVERLFAGQKATVVMADPPYGMGKESDGVLNDNLYNEKLDEFQTAWFRACRPHVLDTGSSMYVWGNSPDLWRWWYGGFKDVEKLSLRNEIVWDKVSIAGMKSGLMTQYPIATERCLFIQFGDQFLGNVNADQYWDGWDEIRLPLLSMAERAGLDSKLCKDVTGTAMYSHWFSKSQWAFISEKHYVTLQARFPEAFTKSYAELRAKYDEIKGGYRNHVNGILGGMRAYFDNTHDVMTDVWAFPRVVGDERFGHATPKPVSMIERILLSSSPEGSLAFEPFGGTGPTMLAAERTGRQCVTSELQTEYCAVILERMTRAGCSCKRERKKRTTKKK